MLGSLNEFHRAGSWLNTGRRLPSAEGGRLFNRRSRKHALAVLYFCLLTATLSTLLAPRARATHMPPGIVDPTLALKDPVYSDAAFWAHDFAAQNVFEPPAYFYWPSAVIKGTKTPVPLPVAKSGHTTLSARARSGGRVGCSARQRHAHCDSQGNRTARSLLARRPPQ